VRCSFAGLTLLAAAAAAAQSEGFAGDYRHTMTARPDEAVWQVRARDGGWELTTTGDGERVAAHRLEAAGRAAFWKAMQWPTDTSAGADCLSWGTRPRSLMDVLADEGEAPKESPAPGTDYGFGVLCRVDRAQRPRIDALADQHGDWFFYDPVLGVTEAVRLRD